MMDHISELCTELAKHVYNTKIDITTTATTTSVVFSNQEINEDEKKKAIQIIDDFVKKYKMFNMKLHLSLQLKGMFRFPHSFDPLQFVDNMKNIPLDIKDDVSKGVPTAFEESDEVIDSYEDNNNYYVVMEVGSLDKSDIKFEIISTEEGDILVIKGKKGIRSDKPFRKEVKFKTKFENIKPKAKILNGILNVEIPKTNK